MVCLLSRVREARKDLQTTSGSRHHQLSLPRTEVQQRAHFAGKFTKLIIDKSHKTNTSLARGAMSFLRRLSGYFGGGGEDKPAPAPRSSPLAPTGVAKAVAEHGNADPTTASTAPCAPAPRDRRPRASNRRAANEPAATCDPAIPKGRRLHRASAVFYAVVRSVSRIHGYLHPRF